MNRAYLAIVSIYTALMLGAIAGGFVVSSLFLAGQVSQNRSNGNVTRALICEVIRHDHLSASRCPVVTREASTVSPWAVLSGN